MKHTFEERALSALGYIWILFLIPLLLKRDSKFCQFHGRQGLVLFIAWTLNSVIALIPVLGWIVSAVVFVILLIINILAIVKAYTGIEWRAPYLGEFAEKLKF